MEFKGEFDRSDLAREIAKRCGDRIDDAESAEEVVLEVLRELPEVLADALVEAEGRVDVHDLGVFRIELRHARKGRNFQTGEVIDIPEHDEIVFRAAPNVTAIVSGRTGRHTE